MDAIEKIKQYTERTNAPAGGYAIGAIDWLALVHMESVHDAVLLAYDYGKAKGYRAAKAGK